MVVIAAFVTKPGGFVYNPPPTSVPRSQVTGSGVFRVGGAATLNQEAALAATVDDFDQWTKVAIARDSVGMTAMLRAGQLFIVEGGTAVLVLESGGVLNSRLRVRVTGGPQEGKAGWVAREFVSPP